MNKIWLFFITSLTIVGCTKENFIDTGLAVAYHDYSMYEYMKREPNNWDSTRILIEHAGLVDMFSGKEPEYPKFTFFGPTNISVQRYMLTHKIIRITDMDPEECKEMILDYVYDKMMLAQDVPEGTKSLPWPPIPGEGGLSITTLGGKNCRFFAQTEDYDNVSHGGATYIYLESGRKTYDIASSNIQFTNGVIHAIHYAHTFGGL